MRYEYDSDITKITSGIIAHGVNCQTVMGTGVAKALYDRWSKVKIQFLKRKPVIGDIDCVVINPKLTVCNCYTQFHFGRDKTIQYASYGAIKRSMTLLSIKYDKSEINIPKIGCGLGGLNWVQVKKDLLQIEKDYNIEFVVHIL